MADISKSSNDVKSGIGFAQSPEEDCKSCFIRLLKKKNKSDVDVETMIAHMEELNILDQGVFKTFIQKYPDTAHRKKLCKVLSYKRCQKGFVAFSKGDEGDAAYLILSGGIAIYSGCANSALHSEIRTVLNYENERKKMMAEGNGTCTKPDLDFKIDRIIGDDETSQDNLKGNASEEISLFGNKNSSGATNSPEIKNSNEKIGLFGNKAINFGIGSNNSPNPDISLKSKSPPTGKANLLAANTMFGILTKQLHANPLVPIKAPVNPLAPNKEPVNPLAPKSEPVSSLTLNKEPVSSLASNTLGGLFGGLAKKKPVNIETLGTKKAEAKSKGFGRKKDKMRQQDVISDEEKTYRSSESNASKKKALSASSCDDEGGSPLGNIFRKLQKKKIKESPKEKKMNQASQLFANALGNQLESALNTKFVDTMNSPANSNDKAKCESPSPTRISKYVSANNYDTKLKIATTNNISEEEFKLTGLTELKQCGIMFVVLENPSIIGEMSLESGAPRNATGICVDDCELLRICKKDYTELFKEINMEEKQKKINLLSMAIPELRDISNSTLFSVVYSMKQIKIPKGKIIYFEGMPLKSCIIIEDGIVSVKKELDTDYLDNLRNKKEEARSEADLELQRRIEGHMNCRVSLSGCKIYKTLEICTFGKGQTIGDEVFIEGKSFGMSVFNQDILDFDRIADGNVETAPIYQTKISRFTYEAKTDLSIFIVSKNDIYLAIKSIQKRVKKDFYAKHQLRYNTYINTASRLILDTVSTANLYEIEKVDNVKCHFNEAVIQDKYAKVKKSTLKNISLDHKEELSNINQLLESKINRKVELKKRKNEVERIIQEKSIKNTRSKANPKYAMGNKLASLFLGNSITTNSRISSNNPNPLSCLGALSCSKPNQSQSGIQESQITTHSPFVEKIKFDIRKKLEHDEKVEEIQEHLNESSHTSNINPISNRDQNVSFNVNNDEINSSSLFSNSRYDTINYSSKADKYVMNSADNVLLDSMANNYDKFKENKSSSNDQIDFNQQNLKSVQKKVSNNQNDNKSQDNKKIMGNIFRTYESDEQIGVQYNQNIFSQMKDHRNMSFDNGKSDNRRNSKKINSKNMNKWLKPMNSGDLVFLNNSNKKSFTKSTTHTINGSVENKVTVEQHLDLITEGKFYRTLKGKKNDLQLRSNIKTIKEDGIKHTLPVNKLNDLINDVNVKRTFATSEYDSDNFKIQKRDFMVKALKTETLDPSTENQDVFLTTEYQDNARAKFTGEVKKNQLSYLNHNVVKYDPKIYYTNVSNSHKKYYEGSNRNRRLEHSSMSPDIHVSNFNSFKRDDNFLNSELNTNSSFVDSRKSSHVKKKMKLKGLELPNGKVINEIRAYLN